MSDYFLKFVPTDPKWQPTKEAAERAVELFKSIAPDAHDVEATFYDHVEFHSPVQNWGGVNCPACRVDLEGWFFETLYRIYGDNGFDNLSVTTPCCGLSISLNDLDFGRPNAFGRFKLEAMQPGIDTDEAQNAAFSTCLGCSLRKIWVHL